MAHYNRVDWNGDEFVRCAHCYLPIFYQQNPKVYSCTRCFQYYCKTCFLKMTQHFTFEHRNYHVNEHFALSECFYCTIIDEKRIVTQEELLQYCCNLLDKDILDIEKEYRDLYFK